jgi:hypothetical protein
MFVWTVIFVITVLDPNFVSSIYPFSYIFLPRWGFTPLGESKRFQHDLVFRYLAKYLEDNFPEELAAFQAEYLDTQQKE